MNIQRLRQYRMREIGGYFELELPKKKEYHSGAINLNTAIIHGTDNKYLRHHVCHFENSAMPGQNGNFALAGHSSYRYNQVFNEIQKVNIGDIIKIKTINEEFTYKITEKFETNPDNIEVLNQDNHIKEITIVTCTNGGKDRLIIKGLIE